MNNKPVAWMLTLPDGTHDWILDGNGCEGYIPLYTHPVKELDTDCQYCKQGCIRCDARKQLTDEEIEEVFYELDVGHSATEFARAILRKAQEK